MLVSISRLTYHSLMLILEAAMDVEEAMHLFMQHVDSSEVGKLVRAMRLFKITKKVDTHNVSWRRYLQKREAYDSVCKETEQTTYMRDADC